MSAMVNKQKCQNTHVFHCAKIVLFYVAQAACSACCKAWCVTENLSGRAMASSLDLVALNQLRSELEDSWEVNDVTPTA